MNEILEPHDRPLPAEYRVAVALTGAAVFLCVATTHWVPWFVEPMTALVPTFFIGLAPLLLLVLGCSVAAGMVAVTMLALRWPGPAIALALLPILVTFVGPHDARGFTGDAMHFGVFASLAGITVLASWRRPRAAIAATVAAVLAVWLWLWERWDLAAPFQAVVEVDFYDTGRLLGLGALYTLMFGLVLAGSMWLRRTTLREEERRALAARAGQVEEQSAVVEERARLARDLHDVVAHHVSLIAVRAETAPYTHPALGSDARTVLGDIAADARLALDELRGVLGILGRSGEDAARAPQPTWGDISALVERTRAAGLDVTLTGDVAAAVPPGVGYAAYRVVQEGLTNARKHAPGHAVQVQLEATRGLVQVSVRNPCPEAPVAGAGSGLAGMRERVAALGGRMSAEVVDGRFVVDVTLPVGTPS